MKEKSITTPVNSDIISSLLAGDKVLISGIIYTARDAAHKRLVNLIDNDNDTIYIQSFSVSEYKGKK